MAAAGLGRSSSSQAADDGTHAAWRQLCRYLRRCLEAEAAESLVPYVQENSLWFLHSGEEKLVVGTSDSMPAPGKLSERLTSRTRSMIYGWPTVVVIDRNHMPKVTPLFAVQIEPKRGSDNQWTVHGKTEPEFNLAITASGIFDLSITEEISDLLSHGLPFGDADAFAALAGRTASLLGLQIMSPLNAGKPRIDNQSRTRRLQRRDFSCGRIVLIHEQTSRGVAGAADPKRLVDNGCGASYPRRSSAEGRHGAPVRASCRPTSLQPVTGGDTGVSP